DWKIDIPWLDHCLQRTPRQPVWITESSWHTADSTPGDVYAAKLVELLRLLDKRRVLGITFFCVSARDPDFYHEVWCRSNNKATPDTNVTSRGIATALRQLRPLAVHAPA
ncbi:MAG: hypothetical protein H6651_07850, partial [Ardenticatenales bacterium]|nr:hypothetical protein [Ardenticatenales bacterium]